MPQLSITKEVEYSLIKLSGQFIGGEETDTLKNEISKLIDEDVKKIIIDLEKVTYLNSLSLGVLISSHAKINRKNGKLILCNIKGALEGIFTITKLYLVLHIVKSLEQALELS